MTCRIRPFLVAVTLLVLCVGHLTSYAQSVPRLLHYDGRLFVDGNPAFGSYEVTFSLYETAEGGQTLWSETQDIQPEDGQFSVLLGSVNPLPATIPEDHDELYLGMRVENEPEMTPRLFMAATTFALRSGFADAVRDQSVGAGALMDGAVTSAKLAAESVTTALLADEAVTGTKLAEGAVSGEHLADGAVTADKIDEDAAVVSLNDQTGPVTLTAGSNVSIAQDDGTIIISSTGGGGGGGGGDITAVLAGQGLTGGGDQGDVMLSLADGAVDESKLADAAVTAQKLAADAAVLSINDWRGALALEAGSNVNIEEDDGTFTISASGGLFGGGDITAVNAGTGLTGGGQSGDVTLAVDDEGIATDMIADEAVTTSKLDDGAVSRVKLDADAAVTTLNNQSGEVTLEAGGNVSIEESDGTITISSSGGGGPGDITAVNAGEGLTGGGQTGSVTLSISDAGVTTAKLDDGAVTAGKLASDASVLSLNDRRGEVNLAAGENVSINESGQTITISADEGAGGDITGVAAGTGLTGGGSSGDVTLSLASNAAVTSLNGAAGSVTLQGGDNVSISGSGQTITISADEGAGGDITGVAAGAGLTGGGSSGDVTLLLDTNAAVTSLRGLTSDLSLVGTGDISVTDDGDNTITISSSFEGGDGDITSVTAGVGLTGGGPDGDVSLALDGNAAVTSLRGLTSDLSLVGTGDINVTDNGGDTITIEYIGTPGQTQSSRRWKTNIEPLTNAVDVVKQLRGVSFEWKEDGRDDIGLIAEEVGAVLPEIVVFEENGVDAKSVNYSRLVSVLIEAVKTQQEQLDARDDVIHEMMERLERLERLAEAPSSSSETRQASR